ncbi:iron ABC transporter permease [Neptunomonas sp. CHC150]|uniref:FecCD family ABC transporter permease n=1 Tax=Neptunomonas sp. CHC150 TaxID=2998324 RepID=UPI0025AF2A70|nr:iron ABC transporter permease [Neptunomonas sp. CHC150]MDN2659224.1 iron ABC transporter permease [Neptunomonas sp. CHC150]
MSFNPGSEASCSPSVLHDFYRWRWRDYSFLILKRGLWSAVGLWLCLLMLTGLSLSSGSQSLTPLQALLAAFGVGEPMNVFLVQELRLQRLVAGLSTGFAFGISGCLLQTLAHNRLATPGIIGIDDGATAFAVASIVAVPTSLAPPMLALGGAATAAALSFGLSGGSGARGYRFIVVGIGVGALFGALTNLMLARTDIDSANAAYPWTVGSLNARTDGPIWALAVGIMVCLPLMGYLARQLNTLRFSEAVACGLGVHLKRSRMLTLIVAVLLTALAVAVAGPVGLIALVAPELARYLNSYKSVPLINAGLVGAITMVATDLVGRTALSPIEIPVGVITAVVGGPYLLWILLRPDRR